MLKILDRYLLGKYLASFFFIVLIFSIVAGVVDVGDKIDNYIEEKLSFGFVITEYYLNFIPWINGLLVPLYSLIAVVFFTSRLANDSEFISMIGNGVSFYRILVPYLMGALIIASLSLWFNHLVIPRGNKKKVHFENTYVWKHNLKSRTDNIHITTGENESSYISTLSLVDSSARDMTITRNFGSAVVWKLTASFARPQKGKAWSLEGVRIRTFDGMTERMLYRAKLDTVLGFLPGDLIRRENLKETMTTPELSEFIISERARGFSPSKEFEVEAARRSAEPFAVIVLTIIGLATASRKVRGGMGLHLLLGVGVGATYVFMSKFSATFAIQGGLGAHFGSWIPNIIYGIVAVVLLLKAQK